MKFLRDSRTTTKATENPFVSFMNIIFVNDSGLMKKTNPETEWGMSGFQEDTNVKLSFFFLD